MPRETGSSFFRNRWYPVFSVYNDITGKDDRPAVEAQRDFVGPDLDVMTAFLEDIEDCVSLDVRGVKDYCKDVNGRNVEAGVDKPRTLRNAWLDDMTSSLPLLNGKKKSRVYENPLTPAGLSGLLKRPRYNDGDQPNVDRRLIYIADLTPEYVYALAATAPFHQVRALRDALCKYLAFQPSIKISTYRTPRPVFKMEFHLPSFAWRDIPPEGLPPRRHGPDGKPLRTWIDLSFLKPGKTKEAYGVYEAQMSFALCGIDDWQWVAYSFVDADHDGYTSTDRATVERCEQADGVRMDPISNLPADCPIWNPRLYFLKVFEVRSKQVGAEWDLLVSHLRRDIRQYKKDHSFTWPQNQHHQSAAGNTEKMKESFNWALQTMDALDIIQDMLGNICREWKNFDRQDNIDSFFDFNEFSCDTTEIKNAMDARQYLQNIKETFDKLEAHQQKLISLNNLLDKYFLMLQVRLSLEVNVTAEHNGFTTYFSLWVLYPITLATSIFSMQPTVIPFDLTPMWYCITVGILFGGMAILYCVMMRLFLGHRKEATQPEQETVHLLERIHRFSRGRPPGQVQNQA